MDATFSVHEVNETEEKKTAPEGEVGPESKSAPESKLAPESKMSVPEVATAALSTVGEDVPEEVNLASVKSASAKSASARSTPTRSTPTPKRSRRTTSLDLLYQNIK